jgi:hypothetical protein
MAIQRQAIKLEEAVVCRFRSLFKFQNAGVTTDIYYGVDHFPAESDSVSGVSGALSRWDIPSVANRPELVAIAAKGCS